MKKKILLILAIMAAALSLMTISASAAVEYKGIYYNILESNGTASLSAENQGCELTNVVIPETFEYGEKTYTVTGMDVNAFQYNKTIQSVSIPKTVVFSYGYLFRGCTNLSSVTIDSENESTLIPTESFIGTAITTIVLPESITEIGGSAFHSCKNLASIELPKNVTTIGDGAFQFCSALTSIKIPERVTKIGHNVLHGCSGLREITVPAGCTVHGQYSFNQDGSKITVKYTGTEGDNGYNSFKSYLTRATYEFVNHCEVYYNGEHAVGEVHSCMKAAACTRAACNYATDASSLPTEHKIKESFVFKNGFTDKGVYSCICENASYCTEVEGYALNETYEAIFTALGYSVRNDGTALMGGYKINPVSFEKYNEYAERKGLPTVSYGIIISNANGVTIDGGALTSGFGFKLPANDKVGFSKLNYTITDFKATSELVNLEFVIALYIEVDGELTFVQSATKTGEAEASVEGEATALNTISLKTVVDLTIEKLQTQMNKETDTTEKEKLQALINNLKVFSVA